MQPNIYKIIFHSLLFSIGVGPTVAILPFLYYQYEFNSTFFAGVALAIAVIAIPIVLIQNGYLLYKRSDEQLAEKLAWLVKVYFCLNALCLVVWIIQATQGMF